MAQTIDIDETLKKQAKLLRLMADKVEQGRAELILDPETGFKKDKVMGLRNIPPTNFGKLHVDLIFNCYMDRTELDNL